MATLQKVVGNETLAKILVYVNGILVPVTDPMKHIALLDEVLSKLEEADMTVNLNNCTFMISEANSLGFIITP